MEQWESMMLTSSDGGTVAQVEGRSVVLGIVQRPTHLHASSDLEG